MFHNLLVQQGYIVLDMDYRASEGYGRDWRTAIYRQMGTPELEDYIDGVNWMVANQQGDAAKRRHLRRQLRRLHGLHGDVPHAGRVQGRRRRCARSPTGPPTTTNTPPTSSTRPKSIRRPTSESSPIEFAEGLRGHLLIAHGMMDDNVFYQDSVRLAQRLIELKKDHWELASYPLERHGFVQPESLVRRVPADLPAVRAHAEVTRPARPRRPDWT